MRLKSSIFVSALMRQENINGAFATILNRGAEEAGAIFIVHLRSGGKADFYGPAPQSLMDASDNLERWFECLGEGLDEDAVSARMASQLKFDPDCWIVEIEKNGDLQSILVKRDDTRA